MDTIITAVAKPFTNFPRGKYTFAIDASGIVRVWDSVAGHYTRCHSMSTRGQQRIRTLADAQ